jgi:hypothetical protein
MKPYLWIPFALLLGLVIGGWGPRSELQTLREDLKKTKKLLQETKKHGGGSDVGQVTRLLGIEGQGRPAADAPAREAAADRSNGAARAAIPPEPSPTASAAVPPPPPGETGDGTRPAQRNREEELETAIELWKLRSDIARSTFLANGHLSDEQAMNFDVLIEAMNVRLAHSIETWAAAVETKDVNAEDGIRLMSQVTDALVLTYDEMDRKLPNNWRQAGGKGMQLMDFIDPSVARPLLQVEGKVNQIQRSFGEGRDSREGGPRQ